MTDTEIRIVIAEKCGWVNLHVNEIYGILGTPPKSISGNWDKVPDYPNDLNACHEFEETLAEEHNGEGSGPYYRNILGGICGTHAKAISATARQRCEAFLRAHGPWKQ